VVGMEFGAEFVRRYQKHPDAQCYAICPHDKAKTDKVGDLFKVGRRYTYYEDVFADRYADAIPIVTPIAATRL
jgi:predicted dehydrogenase